LNPRHKEFHNEQHISEAAPVWLG